MKQVLVIMLEIILKEKKLVLKMPLEHFIVLLNLVYLELKNKSLISNLVM